MQEENSKFQKLLTESSVALNRLAKRIGERLVTEARPYYESIHKLKCLQIKCQKAAIKYEKYNELHIEAKQAIADTELIFHREIRHSHRAKGEEIKEDELDEEVDSHDGNFDHSWQEKLNQANINVSSEEHLWLFIKTNLIILPLELTHTVYRSKGKAAAVRGRAHGCDDRVSPAGSQGNFTAQEAQEFNQEGKVSDSLSHKETSFLTLL